MILKRYALRFQVEWFYRDENEHSYDNQFDPLSQRRTIFLCFVLISHQLLVYEFLGRFLSLGLGIPYCLFALRAKSMTLLVLGNVLGMPLILDQRTPSEILQLIYLELISGDRLTVFAVTNLVWRRDWSVLIFQSSKA